jgi:mannose-6-phosphate isomerase-like protein (cupin superfamily)
MAVVKPTERRWETWPDDQLAERGPSSWKTLVSAGATDSDTLSLGVSRLPPGGVLPTHRHAPAEVYYVLAGAGVVVVEGVSTPISAGDAVFVPADAPHSVACTGETDLEVVYVLAADAFDDVEYVFDG